MEDTVQNLRSFCLAVVCIVGLFCVGPVAAVDTIPIDANATTELVAAIVDVNVAIVAAADYLPYYYPGNWQYFKHFVCYDINGVPAAYAIVFRDPNSQIADVNQLDTAIADFRQKRQDAKELLHRRIVELAPQDANSDETAKKLRKEESKFIRSQYFTSVFATVITSAVETEPVIQRCYRGLPEFLVKQRQLQEELDANTPILKLGRLIYLSPVDIRYEAVPPQELKIMSQGVGEMKNPQRQHIKDDSLLLSFKGEKKGLEKVSDQRLQRQQIQQQKAAMNEKLSKEQRERIEQGARAAKQHNASNWAEYKTKSLKPQQKKEGGNND
jgi:hypothetical protein